MVILSSFSRDKWVGIPGTWGAKNESKWWARDSAFSQYLATRLGIYPVKPDESPFIWSTDLVLGLPALFGSSKHSDWKAAGAALSYYLKDVPIRERNIISHSHGLQAVLYACSDYGVKLNTLTSVTGPVRKDMLDVAERARPNIGYWTHIHSDWSDTTQILGHLFDGTLGIVRKHPLADLNVKIPKVGHSKLLHESAHFSHWDSLLYPITQDYGKKLTPRSGGT